MNQPPTSPLLRRLRQLRAAAALAAILLLALPWLILPRHGRTARRIAELGWGALLRGFGVAVRVHGRPAFSGETLTVCNHVSWLDIAVLARLGDAGFVAKADIAGWPVIGPLAQAWGCQFVSRTSRARIPGALSEMQARTGRHGLILFPEGTTGPGPQLLPFRSSLFPGSASRWRQVQPVLIDYRRADGGPLSAGQRRTVAWLDADELLPHAFALAAMGGLVVDVWFEPPIAVEDRKQAARASQAVLERRIERIALGDQAATWKRAA